MSQKPKLYYLNGRGKMESIRWLLAAAGVEFEEEFLKTREQFEALVQGAFEINMIDMYVEGTTEFMEVIMSQPFLQSEEKGMQPDVFIQKAKTFSVYEKVLRNHGQDFLVGNQFSWADI
ncbi:hypothetical protein XELAEV_18027341mg [Xenopus laevis]|uniref:glutathione transferase n=1 Tax=Xenopus laevis TaxID=8355 RepID=A0A974CXK9_XENLA|nr:hypothetical protein XELAEV_18027341mg [Xenopus laevis]